MLRSWRRTRLPTARAARLELTRPHFALSSNRSRLITAALPELGAKGQAIIDRFYVALTDGGLVNGALQGMMSATGHGSR